MVEPKIYNKLVRDYIPRIITETGKIPHTRIAKDKEYFLALQDKLQEEVAEYLGSNSPEELADIMEVVHALALYQNINPQDLEEIRVKKAKERGGFLERIILEKVTSK
ncbi:nucleoside triphosphate pyrophosphohydrolase [Candidatus Woesearchaeota archaeon]|nr:nucleoside triphosphate pyrophosphohydrolase [Candidatus Woesearchaeota archaeon]